MTQSDYVGDAPPDDGREWVEVTRQQDLERRWTVIEPVTPQGIAVAARKARVEYGIAEVKSIFQRTIEQLEALAADDCLERVDIRAEAQTIDATCDTDEYVNLVIGPWRRVEIVWQKREVSG